MANPTSKVNLVINGVTTSYDIHDANAVDLTSNQTVGGIKTFSSAPVVNSISLDGKIIDTDANGNMTFDSHIVDTIEEQGNEYIRYSNGLQICYGLVVNNNNIETGRSRHSYPMAFIAAPSVVATPRHVGQYFVTTYDVGTTNWQLNSVSAYGGVIQYTIDPIPVNYVAIGTWK